MRHHNKNRKFGREKGQRKALLRALVRSLVIYGKVETSVARAKELRPTVEKLITRAKSDTLHSRRLLLSRTGSAQITSRLIKDVAPKYKNRAGGYTRIVKTPTVRKDASEQAIVEFV